MDSTTRFETQSQKDKTAKFIGYGFVWLLIIAFVEVIPFLLGESMGIYHVFAVGMLLASFWNFRTGLLLGRNR